MSHAGRRHLADNRAWLTVLLVLHGSWVARSSPEIVLNLLLQCQPNEEHRVQCQQASPILTGVTIAMLTRVQRRICDRHKGTRGRATVEGNAGGSIVSALARSTVSAFWKQQQLHSYTPAQALPGTFLPVEEHVHKASVIQSPMDAFAEAGSSPCWKGAKAATDTMAWAGSSALWGSGMAHSHLLTSAYSVWSAETARPLPGWERRPGEVWRMRHCSAKGDSGLGSGRVLSFQLWLRLSCGTDHPRAPMRVAAKGGSERWRRQAAPPGLVRGSGLPRGMGLEVSLEEDEEERDQGFPEEYDADDVASRLRQLQILRHGRSRMITLGAAGELTLMAPGEARRGGRPGLLGEAGAGPGVTAGGLRGGGGAVRGNCPGTWTWVKGGSSCSGVNAHAASAVGLTLGGSWVQWPSPGASAGAPTSGSASSGGVETEGGASGSSSSGAVEREGGASGSSSSGAVEMEGAEGEGEGLLDASGDSRQAQEAALASSSSLASLASLLSTATLLAAPASSPTPSPCSASVRVCTARLGRAVHVRTARLASAGPLHPSWLELGSGPVHPS